MKSVLDYVGAIRKATVGYQYWYQQTRQFYDCRTSESYMILKIVVKLSFIYACRRRNWDWLREKRDNRMPTSKIFAHRDYFDIDGWIRASTVSACNLAGCVYI